MISKIIQKIRRLQFNHRYRKWFECHRPTAQELENQRNNKFSYQPKISILVPVWDVKTKWLDLCVKSVMDQTYQNWELILVDDHSTNPETIPALKKYENHSKIKIFYRPKNGHISACTNTALEHATGEFVTLLDNDDELSPQALYKIVELLNTNPSADLIYSDEDKLEMNGQHSDPSFKPDWSYDMFLSTNYLCHLTTIRKSIVDNLGGFTLGLEGSQDYDLFLRVIEKTNNIYHLPAILYHWRKIPLSTAAIYSDKSYANTASLKAISNHLNRINVKANVENGLKVGTFRVRYQIADSPLVSIIIPSNNEQLLTKCIDSIISKSTYTNFEIVVVNNGDSIRTAFPKTSIYSWSDQFNYSAVNNFGVSKSKGKYLIFLNNDTEIITPDWIESLLQIAQRKHTGAIGCKLLYPIGLVQHSGIILGLGGIANSNFYRQPDVVSQPFPMLNSKDIIRNYSAVTGACLMVSKINFNLVSGFNEQLAIAYNDIDFCLKLRQRNLINVYTPFSILYHHESLSISKDRDRDTFISEQSYMTSKWGNIINHDPYYNLNLPIT